MGEKHKGHVNLRAVSENEYYIIRNKIASNSSDLDYYKLYIVVRLLAETSLTLTDILSLRIKSVKKNEDQYYIETTYESDFENAVYDPKIIWISKNLWNALQEYIKKLDRYWYPGDNYHLIPGRIVRIEKNGKPYRVTKPWGATSVKRYLKDILYEIDREAEALKKQDSDAFLEKYKDYQKYSELGTSSFRKYFKS